MFSAIPETSSVGDPETTRRDGRASAKPSRRHGADHRSRQKIVVGCFDDDDDMGRSLPHERGPSSISVAMRDEDSGTRFSRSLVSSGGRAALPGAMAGRLVEERSGGAETEEDFDPFHQREERVTIQGERFWVASVAQVDSRFKTVPYRRRMMDIMMNDPTITRRMMRDKLSFATLKKISTSDSNVSGLVFTFDADEYLERHLDGFPRKVVIKVASYSVRSRKRLATSNPHAVREAAAMTAATTAATTAAHVSAHVTSTSHQTPEVRAAAPDPSTLVGSFTGTTRPLDPRDPTNIETHALCLLRDTVLSNECPNVILLYKHFLVRDLTTIEHPPAPTKTLFASMREQLHTMPPRIRPEVMVSIMEFASSGSVRRWRTERARSEDEWRVVIFQVLYTLAVLSDKFGWRHNDLHQANVALDRVAPSESFRWKYTYKGVRFAVPSLGVFVKIFDFDWCWAPGLLENGKANSSAALPWGFNMPWPEYDAHRFLNHVYSGSSGRGTLPEGVKRFIERNYPRPFLGDKSAYISDYRLLPGKHRAGDIPTPEDMLLRDEWFAPYRNHPVEAANVIRPEFRYDGKQE